MGDENNQAGQLGKSISPSKNKNRGIVIITTPLFYFYSTLLLSSE